jgi:Domain of unknown function (DUF3885)
MLREDLQKYFDKVYPHSKVDTEHTLGGQVHIRFELGGEELENGTSERVNQAVERACILFNDAFTNKDNEIWVLIYEYEGENIFNASNEYLHQQFPQKRFTEFYNQTEKVVSRYFTTDENGNDIPEEDEVKIIIGKIPTSEINVAGILRGIANTEMGFKPAIDQTIFFFDPTSNKAFQMYDDRGCYIWSNDADTIRDIYIKRNKWIVDYHRPEIDEYFK